MKKSILATTFLLLIIAMTMAQQLDLDYYLPEGNYNPAVPAPASVIGHEVGDWHVSHDRLVNYMYALDKASDRITLKQTGLTYEGRALLLLTITSPKNQQNIETIRAQHLQLSDPQKSGSLDVKNMPVIFYLGCSIHGNEQSGSNAGLIMAYYLAAARGPEIEKYLENTIILLDPSFNPDGLNRYVSWVNSRKSKVISADPNDMEHHEPWPGGRSNHYWFDLNRDWLVAQFPESQARISEFQRWKPNFLTDHHEQGTNSTFFFMPGEPDRVNPLTPVKNQELTRKMGEFHAKALDKIGSLYFTQENYDDFYFGKGSTYPDSQGAIGVLFEQASTRGHAQESINGILRFPFTIRNQFVTMLSLLEAVNKMREELLNYQRDFYRNSLSEAAKDQVKAYLFGSSKDKVKTFYLAELIQRHKIDLYKPASDITISGRTYETESSYIVPLNQPQYITIKAMFEKRTKFKDSLFYDISSWTLPLAFGLEYEELKTTPALGERISNLQMPAGKIFGEKPGYAYIFESYGYLAPRAIYRLLSNGIRTKVSTKPFYLPDGKKFDVGSIMIPFADQDKNPDQIEVYVREIAELDGIDVYGCNTGLDYKGVSLGSNSFQVLKKPVIAILIDGGVSAGDAGEIWHLLDQRYNIPVTMMPLSVLNNASLNKYTTLIVPPGNYNAVSENTKEKLKLWTQNGGVIIGFENALSWLQNIGLGKFPVKKDEENQDALTARPYSKIDEYLGAVKTNGAIFEVSVDLTNPLLYGYYEPNMSLFKSNNIFIEKSKTAYANPMVYGNSPLLSGYIHKSNYDKLKNSSALGVTIVGQGRVIGFTESIAFRAFWFGTNKLLMNAVYYGQSIRIESGR